MTPTEPRHAAGSPTELAELSFPRLAARTQRFSLGRPRSCVVSADDSRVVFLRSAGPVDPVTALWTFDIATGVERLAADPRALGQVPSDLPDAERRRRERAREMAGGITSFAIDRNATIATFALNGVLGIADLVAGDSTLIDTAEPVADPRPAPDGSGLLVYVTGDRLVVSHRNGTVLREISGPAGTTCGATDFIAAEEFGRVRGFWWAPDGSAILAAVVDSAPVQTWYIADPASPAAVPAEHRYPAAGTDNATVSLIIAPVTGGPAPPASIPVTGWDTAAFPYLVGVDWSAAGLLITVLSRDQRTQQNLVVDPGSGRSEIRASTVSEHWVEVVPGLPRLLDDGRLLTADEAGARRRLALDGVPFSPESLHISAVRHIGHGAALVVGTEDDPTVRHLYAVPLPTASGDQPRVSRLSSDPGVHDATVGDAAVVTTRTGWQQPGSATSIRRGGTLLGTLRSYAAVPPLAPNVRVVRGGERDLRVAIVLPSNHRPGTLLPVLMDPYGGPHHAEVLAAQGMWLEPQWFADQGFAVVVADGRGTPGRDLAWERAIQGDLASVPLQDQVDALAVAAAHEPDLDTSRVGIRGWSFGGYLAALAVLRRPDVFHAAIAGAPVTDWALYDTGYTERYLGTDPQGKDAAAYRISSLIDDAPNLSRPLLLMHGLADDNVVAAHTLRLSAALLAAGKPHDVLPITGATHMAAADEVAENLLALQVSWLRRALT